MEEQKLIVVGVMTSLALSFSLLQDMPFELPWKRLAKITFQKYKVDSMDKIMM